MSKKGMKIAVCIKQVPATTNAKIDPETKRLVREGIESIINPFDLYALEQAVLLKEEFGGEVIALSMGPKKALNALREAVSAGADRAVFLNDRAFAGSDTFATSYALSMAIKKLTDVDLIICGKQAIDGDTAQVGPGIAAWLGLPQATYVSAFEEGSEKTIRVRRMHEDGYDICDLDLPAVITVVKDINSPRIPTLKGRLASLEMDIPVWSAEDIEADRLKLGSDGSPTRVNKIGKPSLRSKETIVLTGKSKDVAKGVLHQLRVRSLL